MSFLDPDYEYHEFYLDSGDATNAFSSEIQPLNWPMFNLATPLKDVVSFKVLEAQIPMSYNVVSGAYFSINYYAEFTAGSTRPTPVSIRYYLPTSGVYSGAEIAADLSAKLLANPPKTPGTSDPLPGWLRGASTQTYLVCTFVSTADSETGLPYFKLEVNDHTNITNSTVQQDFSVRTFDPRSEDVTGFPKGFAGLTFCTNYGIASSSIPGVKKSAQSPRPALITGSPYLYVSSNAVGNLCKTYLPVGAVLLSGGTSSPQLAKIPISNVVQGQWLVWQDTNQNWFDVDNIATLSQLDIYLQLGNYGGYVDLQGLPFSLKLGVLVKRNARISNNGRGTFIQSTPFFIGQR